LLSEAERKNLEAVVLSLDAPHRIRNLQFISPGVRSPYFTF
jgi:hypothetical protein